MAVASSMVLDLMPPRFSEGLYDWSPGNGVPDDGCYAERGGARIAQGDPEFGSCLELRKSEKLQRLRYMGEMPYREGSYLRVYTRIRPVSGSGLDARIGAWPGGMGAVRVDGLRESGPVVALDDDEVVEVSAVIGPEKLPGVDMVWDSRVMFCHVGVDFIGDGGSILRVEDLSVTDVTEEITGELRTMPGFTAMDYSR